MKLTVDINNASRIRHNIEALNRASKGAVLNGHERDLVTDVASILKGLLEDYESHVRIHRPENPLKERCYMQGWNGVQYRDALERCAKRADMGYDPCGVLRDEFGIDDADLAVELVKAVRKC